jgi:hypothetical protein
MEFVSKGHGSASAIGIEDAEERTGIPYFGAQCSQRRENKEDADFHSEAMTLADCGAPHEAAWASSAQMPHLYLRNKQ